MFLSSESLVVVVLLSFINACIIYNSNTAQYYGGGGVGIGLVKAGGSADVCNYTIHSNTAQYNGRGGVRVTSNGSGSIDFYNWTCHSTYKGVNIQSFEELPKFLLGFNSYHLANNLQ